MLLSLAQVNRTSTTIPSFLDMDHQGITVPYPYLYPYNLLLHLTLQNHMHPNRISCTLKSNKQEKKEGKDHYPCSSPIPKLIMGLGNGQAITK